MWLAGGMSTLFYVLCFFFGFGGMSVIGGAEGAIHEIAGFLLIMIAALFLIGGAVLRALEKISKG